MTTLTGTQTAAVVIMNLEKPQAVEVLKHFSEPEAAAITAEIIRLRHLSADDTAKALNEFHSVARGHLPPSRGGRDLAEELLAETFGAERAAGVLSKVASAMSGTAFDFLSSVEPTQLAGVIEGEMPATIALVVAHLPADKAAVVLAELPDSVRTDVAHSIATMSSASQEAVTIVAEALRARSGLLATRDTPETLGGVQSVVDIINRSDASVEKALLESLEARDSDLAEDIRSRMFTFADIGALDDRDTQRVLRSLEIKTLALALKGAEERVASAIRRNMSERNRTTLDEEMQALGKVRMSEVEEARSEIVRLIRALEQAGDIRVQRGDEDVYVS